MDRPAARLRPYKNFKAYYLHYVCQDLRRDFPDLVC